MSSTLLDIFGNAIWIGGAAAAVYLGVKFEIKELRKDLQVHRSENHEAHQRHENDLSDHELRIRMLERHQPPRVSGWAE